jgi:poly(3-hydroxybutyrate) depolymerase
VVVAAHYCTGSGPDLFGASQFASLADRYGFIVVYPSAPRERHCFDVSTPGALTRDGNQHCTRAEIGGKPWAWRARAARGGPGS